MFCRKRAIVEPDYRLHYIGDSCRYGCLPFVTSVSTSRRLVIVQFNREGLVDRIRGASHYDRPLSNIAFEDTEILRSGKRSYPLEFAWVRAMSGGKILMGQMGEGASGFW